MYVIGGLVQNSYVDENGKMITERKARYARSFSRSDPVKMERKQCLCQGVWLDEMLGKVIVW